MRSGNAGVRGQQQPDRDREAGRHQQAEQPERREKADQEPLHAIGSGRDRARRRRSLAVLSWPQAARMSGPRGVRTGAG